MSLPSTDDRSAIERTDLKEGSAIPVFFGLTLFLSAFLVFYCEPMIGKMVLPFLGGASSVWTTCVLFFQVMLLCGYAYAHFLGKLSLRTQLIGHLLAMAFALVFLPMNVSDMAHAATATQHPVSWLLLRLLVTTAIPFGVAVSSAPLLQNWLSKISTSFGRDPYFLYSASNIGSLAALLAYPVFIEPGFGLLAQSRMWRSGYLLLLLSVAAAAAVVWKNAARSNHAPMLAGSSRPPALRIRAFWLAASFVPSALMLAVTNHISASLAAAPFLWVIPIAVYLLTFALAFARTSRISALQVSRIIPVILLLSPYVTISAPISAGLVWIVLPVHIAILFSGAMLCHTALAASRPDPRHLTEFYFWIALGGALAGLFAVIVAPRVFSTVFEYPLLVATLGFFRRPWDLKQARKREDWVYPGLIGIMLAIEWLVFRLAPSRDVMDLAAVLTTNGGFVVIYGFRNRAFRFALALAIFIVGSALILPPYFENGQRLYVGRNFFGVKKVLFNSELNLREMLHGDIVHGAESTMPDKSGEPLSYYHASGPAGDVMQMLDDRPNQRVGIVGLGAGSLAAYARPDRRITFFDLDPQVLEIANGFFTYLRRCGQNCSVVIADGRLAVAQTADQSFDLLVIDAFSSDSIPAHLVSQEAVKIYLSKLKSNGVLLFHASNRYMDVRGLVSAVLIAGGLPAFVRQDLDNSVPGKSRSVYVVSARRASDLGSLPTDPNWRRAMTIPEIKPWTDDYSNVLSLIRCC